MIPGIGPGLAGAACLAIAVIGRLTAQAIPATPAHDTTLAINWNPLTETLRTVVRSA